MSTDSLEGGRPRGKRSPPRPPFPSRVAQAGEGPNAGGGDPHGDAGACGGEELGTTRELGRNAGDGSVLQKGSGVRPAPAHGDAVAAIADPSDRDKRQRETVRCGSMFGGL